MASNKRQCPYGHFYNADKYEQCPICDKDMLSVSRAQAFDEVKKITTASQTPINPPVYIPATPPADTTRSVFEYQSNDGFAAPAPQKIDRTFSILNDIPVVEPFTSYVPETTPVFDASSAFTADYVPAPDPVQSMETASSVTNYTYAAEPVSPPPIPNSFAQASLLDEVSAVVSHKDTEDVKTFAIWSSSAGIEMVVGWLVCVKGEYFGQSFNLKTGNNSVGRAMDMDVPLAQEPSISRNKHCIITFDPQSQSFYIQQGESSGLTYLNDEMIMSPTKMKEQDSIKLGTAKFLLIPFCSKDFRWEDCVI